MEGGGGDGGKGGEGGVSEARRGESMLLANPMCVPSLQLL